MSAVLVRESVADKLVRRAALLHAAYGAHIELDCCWNGRLCEDGLWLQREADAVGRRAAIAQGREVMW